MPITAVVNQKGGVGKTTTTINLGRAFARLGQRVLLVDTDEQGALTYHFLGAGGEELASLYDVVGRNAQTRLADAITNTDVDNIDLMPANEDLALLANDLVVAGVGRETRLAQALAAVSGDYHRVLIDCPPSLNLLTINALTAADQVLVVTEPELYSGRAVGKLLDTVDAVRRQLNPSLSVAGVLINKYDRSEEIHARRAHEIREQLAASEPPVPVLPTLVPRWTTVMRTTDTSGGDLHHPAGRRLTAIYRDIVASLTDTAADHQPAQSQTAGGR